MLNNYLRTAARALAKQKLHLGLNLFGLSVGLAATLLILLWVSQELSFDRMQPKAAQTYRVSQEFVEMGVSVPVISPVFADKLVANFPQVAASTQLGHIQSPMNTVTLGTEPYNLNGFVAADPRLTDFFAFNALEGSLAEVLASPNKLALSSRQAKRLFGQASPLGRQLLWQGQPLTVAAVFADLPENSHLGVDAVTGLASMRARGLDSMLDNPAMNFSFTYLRVPDPKAVPALEQGITDLINGLAYDGQKIVRAKLRPLTDIHLHSQQLVEMKTNGSAQSVWMGMGLAAFILLVACFNFINLATARSGLRAKEVGVRKALGASRGQLVAQFLTESVLLTALATLLACVWVELSLPAFNQMMNSQLVLDYSGPLGLMLPALVLLVGLLAGAYPAFYLSAFNPAKVLSGDLIRGQGSIRLRKGLVWLQSAISIGLLVCTCALYTQLQYNQSRPLGYGKDQVLVAKDLPAKLYEMGDRLAGQLDKVSGVRNWTIVDHNPTEGLRIFRTVTSNGQKMEFVGMVGAGFDLVKTLDLKLLAGRDFERRFQGDWYNKDSHSLAVIINRQASLQAGFASPRDALGQDWLLGDNQHGKVVGVVENLKLGANTEAVKPMFFALGLTNSVSVELLARFEDRKVPALVDNLTVQLQRLLPGQVIDIGFLDSQFQALFDQQRRQQRLLLSFSSLAILLTCVGLFGLAAFSCERRTKEIAVRKVLGASRGQLVALIGREFLALVLAGSLLAWPLSWWAMNDWLGHFAERISLQPLWFPLATAAMMLLAGATVAVLALKAASAKPALALRYE
ncbi:FtsX-like permease family protein [Gallaecimonas kandeliae]|uniref:ABC transporter permease n=1 Tax=Gallaecimonas kandeliae TaxID=3029055 RepID=UPI0026473746|nr:ABC transporter permease [Gallaecimonas kandeliae]WKE65489.1 FtsX-like permease family protein [Gallaecimonas kandeliae]